MAAVYDKKNGIDYVLWVKLINGDFLQYKYKQLIFMIKFGLYLWNIDAMWNI